MEDITFYTACATNNEERVIELLASGKVNPQFANNEPLEVAVLKHHKNIVKILLKEERVLADKDNLTRIMMLRMDDMDFERFAWVGYMEKRMNNEIRALEDKVLRFMEKRYDTKCGSANKVLQDQVTEMKKHIQTLQDADKLIAVDSDDDDDDDDDEEVETTLGDVIDNLLQSKRPGIKYCNKCREYCYPQDGREYCYPQGYPHTCADKSVFINKEIETHGQSKYCSTCRNYCYPLAPMNSQSSYCTKCERRFVGDHTCCPLSGIRIKPIY